MSTYEELTIRLRLERLAELRDLNNAPGIIQRLWSRVNFEGEGGCWLWKGGRDKQGYGRIWSAEVGEYAMRKTSRVALFGANDYDYKEWALHTCDNPPCCNPVHLFAGDESTNYDDLRVKGRGNRPIGERAYASVLTEADVREIRKLRAEGMSCTRISLRYDVTSQAIYDIVWGKTWKHVK